MTKQEIGRIKARLTALAENCYFSYKDNLNIETQRDYDALLIAVDAIDALEEKTAYVKALERAVNQPNCQNPECNWYFPCNTCNNDSDFCDHLCNSEGDADIDMDKPCPYWQFDLEQFSSMGKR